MSSSKGLGGAKWQHLLMMAGGAAAVGGIAYYLFRDESPAESSLRDGKKKKGSGASNKRRIKKDHSEYTRDDVLEILKDISASQENMKTVMKELTKELIADNLGFEETYERVKVVQPEDPLERHQVSMADFDSILERYQTDNAVREAITSIMGAPAASSVISSKAEEVPKDTIIKIHEFMLAQLKQLADHFKQLDKTNFEMKTVTIAAQALVGAKVEQQFGLTPDDIESAVLVHHDALTSDSEFARINIQMQSTMSQLMGQQFPSGYF